MQVAHSIKDFTGTRGREQLCICAAEARRPALRPRPRGQPPRARVTAASEHKTKLYGNSVIQCK